MAVFRIEKTRDYTVMSNHHLKDRTLTLKSKGLLSMMLSLPDEWNYTTRGLAAICRAYPGYPYPGFPYMALPYPVKAYLGLTAER